MPVFLAAWLMLAATPAWAEWVAVEGSDVSVVYVDLADSAISHKTSNKDGNLTRAWVLQDWKARRRDGALSHRILAEFDCAESRSRTLSLAGYSGPMATGTILSFNDTAGNWIHLSTPGTVGASLFQFRVPSERARAVVPTLRHLTGVSSRSSELSERLGRPNLDIFYPRLAARPTPIAVPKAAPNATPNAV